MNLRSYKFWITALSCFVFTAMISGVAYLISLNASLDRPRSSATAEWEAALQSPAPAPQAWIDDLQIIPGGGRTLISFEPRIEPHSEAASSIVFGDQATAEVRLGGGNLRVIAAQLSQTDFKARDYKRFLLHQNYTLPYWHEETEPQWNWSDSRFDLSRRNFPVLRLKLETENLEVMHLEQLRLFDQTLQLPISHQTVAHLDADEWGQQVFSVTFALSCWFPADAVLVADVIHSPKKVPIALNVGAMAEVGKSKFTVLAIEPAIYGLTKTQTTGQRITAMFNRGSAGSSGFSLWLSVSPSTSLHHLGVWAGDKRLPLLPGLEERQSFNSILPVFSTSKDIHLGQSTRTDRVHLSLGRLPLDTLPNGERDMLKTIIGPAEISNLDVLCELVESATCYRTTHSGVTSRFHSFDGTRSAEALIKHGAKYGGNASIDHYYQTIHFGGEPSWIQEIQDWLKSQKW